MLLITIRYLMVCHSSAIIGREKKVGTTVLDLLILISVGIAIESFYYSDSILIFLLCMGKEERFYLEISGQKPGTGTFTRLQISNPFRLSFLIAGFLYVFVVPILYYKIFKFRKKRDNSVQGSSRLINKIKPHFLLCRDLRKR